MTGARAALPWLVATALYVGLLLAVLVTPFPRLHAHPRAYLREFPVEIGALAKDVVLNVIVFVPLGWLLTQALGRTAMPAPWVIGVVTGFAALLSLGVETMQYFIATRYSSVVDVLGNTAGACLGAIAVRRAPRTSRSVTDS